MTCIRQTPICEVTLWPMEIRPSVRQMLPPVVKNLLIINGLFYLASIVVLKSYQVNIIEYFGLFYVEFDFFKPWQIITHMFMHAFVSPNGAISFEHILFNMFGLWMFGSILEHKFGSKRFLLYYIIAGLGAALVHQLVQMINYHYMGGAFPNYPTVGASGAVYGLLFAFGYLFPNALLYLFFAIPVKAKFVIIGLAVYGLFAGLGQFVGDNVAHFAHLGGMLAGFIIFKFWKVRYNTGHLL